jgi:hypothetical protein
MKKALQMIRGKEHLTPEGLAKIQEIHAQMNLKRDRSTIDHGSIEITEDWLRGFVDAEGSFYISVTPNKTSALGYRVIATFSSRLRKLAVKNQCLRPFRMILVVGGLRPYQN